MKKDFMNDVETMSERLQEYSNDDKYNYICLFCEDHEDHVASITAVNIKPSMFGILLSDFLERNPSFVAPTLQAAMSSQRGIEMLSSFKNKSDE